MLVNANSCPYSTLYLAVYLAHTMNRLSSEKYTTAMFAAFASAIFSAMNSGHSVGRRQRTSHLNKKPLVGATYGRGGESTPIQSSAFPTSSATAVQDGQEILCRITRSASSDVRASLHALQLRENSFDASRDASDGSRDRRARLVDGRLGIPA